MSLTNAVSGTARMIPITPHIHPQNNIPMVAATGPMFTRDPMNLGTSKFEETK